MKKILALIIACLITTSVVASERKLEDYPELPISEKGEYLSTLSGKRICLTEQEYKENIDIWKAYCYRGETLVGLRNFVFQHMKNKELRSFFENEPKASKDNTEMLDRLWSETTSGKLARINVLGIYDTSFTQMFKHFISKGFSKEEAAEWAMFRAYNAYVIVLNNSPEKYLKSYNDFWSQEKEKYEGATDKENYCIPISVKEHTELFLKYQQEAQNETEANKPDWKKTVKDYSVKFLVIILCIFAVVFVFGQIYKFKQITEQIKKEFDSFLRKQKFNLREESKYSVLLSTVVAEWKQNKNVLVSLEVIIGITLLAIYNFSESTDFKAVATIIGIIILFCTILNVVKVSHFKEASLETFTCPKCGKRVCFFVEKEFDTDKEHYTKHERKEETDSKGKTHIVYKPIDYVKYKHHIIYRCDKCHHEKEVTKTRDYRTQY